MMWLKGDVGLPRVLRRRIALYARLERQPEMGCVDGCVKYPDSHVQDYPLPDGTVCDGRPSSAPRAMRKISW
jgi:hypothetical protein